MVQKIRIRYAKRGRLRFASHRDFARALERAVRRAGLPIAYSAGFSPHPKISYVGASPTGVASEAEYAELSLARRMDPQQLRRDLDAVLPDGFDIVDAVEAKSGNIADRIDVSRWRIELPGVAPEELRSAVAKFTAADEVLVERLTKQGRRTLDVRAAVHSITVPDGDDDPTRPSPVSDSAPNTSAPEPVSEPPCAILDVVVRHVTPSVRPDEVLAGLRVVAGLVPPSPVRATRLAQGTLTEHGEIADPLAADRDVVPQR